MWQVHLLVCKGNFAMFYYDKSILVENLVCYLFDIITWICSWPGSFIFIVNREPIAFGSWFMRTRLPGHWTYSWRNYQKSELGKCKFCPSVWMGQQRKFGKVIWVLACGWTAILFVGFYSCPEGVYRCTVYEIQNNGRKWTSFRLYFTNFSHYQE
jgi:hypothetical protein